MVLAAYFVSAALLSLAAIAALLPLLRRSQVLDLPNHRSSHQVPTPRGAGLALIPVVALLWSSIAVLEPVTANVALMWAAAGAVLLCALSWLDDLRSLSPLLRFGAHIVVIAALLYNVPPDVSYLQGVFPLWVDRLIAGFIWLWFINLFNFMDGIDGISGVETGAVAAGLIAIAVTVPAFWPIGLPAAVLAGAACGFLVLNWHPAKIFLGDSGSIPLGLLLGWLLLQLAAAGHWAAALILPLYYLADATITISRRLLRGEKIWQAHRQHFYQRAVAGGASHSRVSLMIALANFLLIVCALVSIITPWPALAAAVLIVFALLTVLKSRAPAP